jgi:hypothetical protein
MPLPTPSVPEPLPAAARERVVELLTRHFGRDALSETELEGRPERVYAVTGVHELEGTVVRITGRVAFRFVEAFIGPRTEER